MAISKISSDALAAGAPSRSQLPAGTVLQVVQADRQGEDSTTSTSFVTASLTASITPTSASSKILILVTFSGGVNNTNEAYYTISKNGVDLVGGNGMGRFWNAAAANYTFIPSAVSYLDSPGTTSAITYSLRFRTSNSATRVYISGANARDSITLMEIAA